MFQVTSPVEELMLSVGGGMLSEPSGAVLVSNERLGEMLQVIVSPSTSPAGTKKRGRCCRPPDGDDGQDAGRRRRRVRGRRHDGFDAVRDVVVVYLDRAETRGALQEDAHGKAAPANVSSARPDEPVLHRVR